MDLHRAPITTSHSLKLLALALHIPLILASAPSLALGLGNASLKTTIGDPLVVEIPILDRNASLDLDQVRVKQVLGNDAEQMGYDLAANAQPFRINVDEISGALTIQVTSPAPLYEPFVSFVLEVSWPGGTLYRGYNLLMDLPPIDAPSALAAKTQSRTPIARSSAEVTTTYSGQQWRVEPGQSLWSIARQIQPDSSIPLDTVMAAIHARNPHAFQNGDMNRLQAGAVLDLPSTFNYPVPAAVASRRTTAAPGSVASEANFPPAETASPATAAQETPPEGRLRLSGNPVQAGDGRAAHLREELDVVKEQLDKVNRDNEQLRQQIQRIESSEYMDVMKELMQLQEQRILELKAQMDASPTAKTATDSARTIPGGISTAAPSAEPAPVIARDVRPSYSALIILILAAMAVGMALSQLHVWWRNRRMAAEFAPEDPTFSLDPLPPLWGGELPPPAPELDAAETEKYAMAVAGDIEEDQQSTVRPAAPRSDSHVKSQPLKESARRDNPNPSVQQTETIDEHQVPYFADIDLLSLETTESTELGSTPGDRESDDAEVRSAIKEQNGMAGAEAVDPSNDSAEIISSYILFDELEFDESFGHNFIDLSAQSNPLSDEELELDFAAFELELPNTVDPVTRGKAPGVAKSDDADAKNATSLALV